MSTDYSPSDRATINGNCCLSDKVADFTGTRREIGADFADCELDNLKPAALLGG